MIDSICQPGDRVRILCYEDMPHTGKIDEAYGTDVRYLNEKMICYCGKEATVTHRYDASQYVELCYTLDVDECDPKRRWQWFPWMLAPADTAPNEMYESLWADIMEASQ